MPVREFLRGGYQTITEPTIIIKHGYPVFTVFPAPGNGYTKQQRGATLPPGSPGPSPNGG